MTIVPKSGWPVMGQTAVNSGQVISISYSRLGNWFGNVCSRRALALAIGHLLDSVRFGRLPVRRIGPGLLSQVPGNPLRPGDDPAPDSTDARVGWRGRLR